MKTIHTFLMAAAVALSVVGTASANLIVNGDFSANASAFVAFPGYVSGLDFGGGSFSSPLNPAAISSWGWNGNGNPGVNGINTGTSGPITAFGPSVQQTTPDRNWAFIQGSGGAITQVINVTPGVEYTVSFLAAGRAGIPANGGAYAFNGTLGVDAFGAEDLAAGTGFFNKSFSDENFVPDSFTFTTTKPTATIVFQNSGGGDAVNFTNVVAVPEPSTLAGLAIGVVALGLASRRK